MKKTEFIPYARQSISPEDIEAVSQALAQPIITRGPLVEEFEKSIADYCGAAYAVTFNSGSTALMAAYFAAEVGTYDRILTTPNTYIATISGGVHNGANPVFIDIDASTGNIDLAQLNLNINHPLSRGKTVIVPVHYSGIPVDVQAIDAKIANIDTIIIEDAAHAIGSHYKDGTKVGSCAWSQMTVFSFHPAKTITTGEGGMVTTNDEHLFHRLKLFKDNGIERHPPYLKEEATSWYYEVTDLSSNYHFTEMQAALGLSQFKRLGSFIEKRQHLIQSYKNHLRDLEHVRLLAPNENVDVAPHLCVVHINFEAYKTTRTAAMEALKELGIGTQLHYIPLYRHPYFTKRLGGDLDNLSEYFPAMEMHYAQALSLPLYADLTEDQVESVVSSLKKVLKAKH